MLIGSAQADILNGGNNDQGLGAVDTLTGNGGADIFQFNVNTSIPADLTSEIQSPLPVDSEVIRLRGGWTCSTTATRRSGLLHPEWHLDERGDSVYGVRSVARIRRSVAVATAMDGWPVSGNGQRRPVLCRVTTRTRSRSTASRLGGTIETLALAFGDNGTDIEQNERLEIVAGVGGITAGEQYTVTALLREGGGIVGTYEALAGDTEAKLLPALAASFNAAAAAFTDQRHGDAGARGLGCRLPDEVANNGGFTLSFPRRGSLRRLGCLGQRCGGPADGGHHHGLRVRCRQDPADRHAGGNGTTYDDAGSFTTYALALAAATAAMDGNVQYFVTSITDDPTPGYDDTGLLFFDANADGTVDGVIKLTGVNDANFGASDIIAG